MVGLLALRSLTQRPRRTLLLLGGFGIGVGVMIVLLAIGEAMLVQARDERLVGGGEVTVLPSGLDVEVMKTGGIGGIFFSIANARFVNLQLLSSPRLRESVRAVAPQIDGKLLYLRTAAGAEYAVRATGEIPLASAAVGAGAEVLDGAWDGDEHDRRWLAPTPAELRHAIDHFHVTPAGVENRESWAEWHYFNVLSEDRQRWIFVTLAIGGDVPHGEWGGQVLITTHGHDRPDRRFMAEVSREDVQFSTSSADLQLGSSSVTVLSDGNYRVRATAPAADGRSDQISVELELTPASGAYFPGADLGSDALVSSYAVPALRAAATGRICVDTRCERFEDAQGYHDHNWGVWRGVSWEWGASRAGDYTLLYGRVTPPDVAEPPPLMLYVVDSLGFLTLLRPRTVQYEDARTILVDGTVVRVPSRFVLADARGADTLRVDVEVEHATGTDTRRALLQIGDSATARSLERPYFIQMKGVARLSGRVDGRVIAGEGTGFFETYR